MTPIEELREAARLMRERAQEASDPPWSVDEGNCCVVSADGTIEAEMVWQNAGHIAGMHPGVALAVADWLNSVADSVDEESLREFGPAMTIDHRARGVASAYLYGVKP